MCIYEQRDLLMKMDDSPNFYEGAEKLLEVWFEPTTSVDVTDVKWLRTISRYKCIIDLCVRACVHV